MPAKTFYFKSCPSNIVTANREESYLAKSTFIRKCITETIDGLSEGLSNFSGPSRAAVIYAITPNDPVYIFDPQNLLIGHEPKFKELYIDSDNWRKKNLLNMTKANSAI